MKLVINISKSDYEDLKRVVKKGIYDYNGFMANIFRSIAYGTPLSDIEENKMSKITQMTVDEINERSEHQAELQSLFDYSIKDSNVSAMIEFAMDSVDHMKTITNYIWKYRDHTSFDDLRHLLDLIQDEICELTVTGEEYEE